MSEFHVVTQSFVNVTILTDIHPYGVEKKFPKDIKIIDLKNKLEVISGFLSSDIKIKLLNKEKKEICDVDDDERMLGFYPCEDGYFLQVIGSKMIVGTEDDPNFKRYELTDEEYAQKKNTVKEFKKMNKLGQFAEENKDLAALKEKAAKEKIETEKSLIESMKCGNRCQVKIPNAPTRVGTVMYLGPLDGKPGYFVGVKYDEPLGKNDGSTPDGKRYFQCLPNYGGFVKPDSVTVGDFAEETFDEF
jgi:tubulin-specific chaperone B